MKYRTIGRTGIQVTPYCLGAMMFGAWGNPDHDECIRIIHAALDGGINFIDTADVYSAGESEEIVGKALAGRRDSVVLATKFYMPMGDDPNMARRQPPLDHRGGREQPAPPRAPTTSTCTKSTGPIPAPTSTRRSARSATSSITARSASSARRPSRPRTSSRRSGPPSDATASASRASSRRTRCSPRGIETAVLPTCETYGMGVIAWSPLAGGWLTGKYRKGDAQPTSHRAQRIPQRFDFSLPENQRKLELVDELAKVAADAGLSMTHMAMAFVVGHPAVTSAIIGPRTMEQLTDVLAGASRRAVRRHARRARQDRRARRHAQPGRCRLGASVDGAVLPPASAAGPPRAASAQRTQLSQDQRDSGLVTTSAQIRPTRGIHIGAQKPMI